MDNGGGSPAMEEEKLGYFSRRRRWNGGVRMLGQGSRTLGVGGA